MAEVESDALTALHVHISSANDAVTNPMSSPNKVSPRLVPYIQENHQYQHDTSDQPSSCTDIPANDDISNPRTSSGSETQMLLHDLTLDEYDEMSKLESEMREVETSQIPVTSCAASATNTTSDQITIDDYGMVRVHGQELIKLEPIELSATDGEQQVVAVTLINGQTANIDGTILNCDDEAKLVDVIIQKIEKNENEVKAETDDDLQIIEEHLDEPSGSGEDEVDEDDDSIDTQTETDSDIENDHDQTERDQAQAQAEKTIQIGTNSTNCGEGECVVIYLNSEVKSKRQIQVNKCERCNLLFGSRTLLYQHYSSVHLSARTTSTSLQHSPGRKRRQPGQQRQSNQVDNGGPAGELILDPAAMVIEVGPKQYKCARCARMFKRSFDVVRHFDCVHNGATADGSQSYLCRHCDKAFSRKDNLMRHERTHDTNRTLFSCETCHKLFTRKFDTIRHYEIVHKKSMTS